MTKTKTKVASVTRETIITKKDALKKKKQNFFPNYAVEGWWGSDQGSVVREATRFMNDRSTDDMLRCKIVVHSYTGNRGVTIYQALVWYLVY